MGTLMTELHNKACEMNAISLEEMSGVKLMNRTDTKYVISLDELGDLMEYAKQFYRIQETNGERLIAYETTYYDTDDWAMLRQHTTGRLTREKVRVRTYVGSNLTFVEVKKKNNHGRTRKKRTEVSVDCHACLDSVAKNYVNSYSEYVADSLYPAIANRFKRITLVNNEMSERLTIDLDLSLVNCRTTSFVRLANTVIVEVKRDGRQPSHITDWLKARRIKESGFSKYCYGALLTNGSLPLGDMKKKIRKLMKRGLLPAPSESLHRFAA